MNRDTFFKAIRPAFRSLNVRQVEGMEALLDAGHSLPLHHMANVLAQVRRETGGHMAPIKETVMPSHKDKNPPDAEVIRRLDRAFAAGKLKWVKTPYWRDGWFGRGQIQLTHKANYAKFGITNPDDAMRPDVSARVAVRGMSEGLFTGKKLADYAFPAALDAPPKQNPRRIVNGQDGSDAEVAGFHRQFAAALEKAGWEPASAAPEAPPVHERTDQEPIKKPVSAPPAAYVAAVMAAAYAVWEWGAAAWDAITFWN
jgi:predicted chitinase